MKENVDYLSVIAEEANVSLEHIKKYYEILSNFSCFQNGNINQKLNCIYYLALLKKNIQNNIDFRFLIDKALYTVYKEEAIPDLSIQFILANNINTEDTINQLKKRK